MMINELFLCILSQLLVLTCLVCVEEWLLINVSAELEHFFWYDCSLFEIIRVDCGHAWEKNWQYISSPLPFLTLPFVFHRLGIEHWSIFVQCRSVVHAVTESVRHDEVLHSLDNLWGTMRTLVSQSVNPCTQQLDHHYGFFSPGVKSILSIPIQHGHCLGIAVQNHPHDPLISHLDQGGEEKTPRVGLLSNVLPTGTAGQRWAFRLHQ